MVITIKRIIYTAILVLYPFTIFCQDTYLGLYSEDHGEIFDALDEIVENHDKNAIEILHSLILTQTPYIQLNYLEVLSELGDQEIITYVNEFIDRSNEFSSHEYREDPLEMKVEGTELLMENNDFSTIEYVFEYYDLYKPNFTSLQADVLDLFPIIAKNVPDKIMIIKENLILVLHNSNNEHTRFAALFYLDEIFGSSIIDQFIWAIEDTYYSIRSFSIDKLSGYQSPELNSLLKERLAIEPGNSLRAQIAEILLTNFGNPSDLKSVTEYQPIEQHKIASSRIEYSIIEFIPPRLTVSTSEMITNLIGYTDELYQYGWITETTIYNQYLDYLKDIEKAYSNKEKELLCEKLDEYLDFTEGLHNSPLLTEEGYKFMHYHGTYIKENVEEEFGECE